MTKIPKELKRFPPDPPGALPNPKDPLQAWDAADELILEHLDAKLQTEPHERTGNVLIIQDSWGALARGALDLGLSPQVYTDSYLSAQSIFLNTRLSFPSQAKVISQITDIPEGIDQVIGRIPRNLSFFEDLLAHLSQKLKPRASLTFGTMVKYQSRGSFDLIHRLIGPTQTTLAKKKARLIKAEFAIPPTPSPWPREVKLDGFELPFVHGSNLFSREGLDIGTRFLLENFPDSSFESVIDMGCANGILGIEAARRWPEARVRFIDESMMAVTSARSSFARQFSESDADSRAIFEWGDCASPAPSESADLVLCNPPFHQGNSIEKKTAWRMFTDARRALKKGGLLRIVGNSHLDYGHKLKAIFANSRAVARNSKFTIWDAEKRR